MVYTLVIKLIGVFCTLNNNSARHNAHCGIIKIFIFVLQVYLVLQAKINLVKCISDNCAAKLVDYFLHNYSGKQPAY